jgi:D-lactate dehydrogenase
MNSMKAVFFEVRDWEKEYLQKAFLDATFFSEKLLALSGVEGSGQMSDAEVISVFVDSNIDTHALEKLPNLKMITVRATGYDNVDIAACKARGIVVCNVPFYGENTVAEHAFGLLLDLSRKIHQSVASVKHDGFSVAGLTGFDLKGRTIGIVGLGHIGQHVARIANGFEMKVIAFDPHEDKKLAKKLGVEYASLEEVLKNSDIITLHVPHNEHTHHLINSQNISLIKKGAYLINTARGGIVETNALIKALDDGTLAGAGLDVLEEEAALKEEAHLLSKDSTRHGDFKVLLQDHVLMERENVIITPHNAFNSKEALERIMETTVENIHGFIDGKIVNIAK